MTQVKLVTTCLIVSHALFNNKKVIIQLPTHIITDLTGENTKKARGNL